MHMCVYMRTYIYMYKPPMCMRMEKGNRKVYRLHGLSYKYTFTSKETVFIGLC